MSRKKLQSYAWIRLRRTTRNYQIVGQGAPAGAVHGDVIGTPDSASNRRGVGHTTGPEKDLVNGAILGPPTAINSHWSRMAKRKIDECRDRSCDGACDC